MKDFESQVEKVRLVDHSELTWHFELSMTLQWLFETVTWAVWFGESGWLVMRHFGIQAGDAKMAVTSGDGKEEENIKTFEGIITGLTGQIWQIKKWFQTSKEICLNFISCQDQYLS